MIFSEDRQSHLVHLIVDGIWNDDIVDYSDEDRAMKVAKQGMVRFVKEFEDIDKSVRTTISSLKRGVMEGSPEWDILYGKYFEQEMQRRGN